MSKRTRTTTRKKTAQTVLLEIPTEMWFLVGQCIEWFEIGTLINFVSVSRMAIRFIQPTLRILVNNLLEVEEKSSTELARYCAEKHNEHGNLVIVSVRRKLGKPSTTDSSVFHKCLTHFYSNDSGTLQQWREWSATILSVINLCLRYEKYNRTEVKSREGTTPDLVNRVCPITVSQACTPLSKIFYFPSRTEDPGGPRPLHAMRATHIAEGMLKDERAMVEMATKEIGLSPKTSEQEIYTSALQSARSTIGHRRALCYYILSKKLTVRAAKATDSLRDVVFADPSVEGEYLHIFSEHCNFVNKIFHNCCFYKGSVKDAPIAFYLHRMKNKHEQKCIKDCITVSKSIENLSSK